MRVNALLIAILSQLAASPVATAEQPAEKVWTQEEMFRRNVGTREDQMTPFTPHKVIGNIHYVGTRSLASFLITTPEGHVLINTNYEAGVPGLKDSVEKLGFRFTDVKIVLGSHAHGDHMEGDALVKEMTGARVMAMAGDVPALERMRPGGKPHPIDRVLHDGERVTLGGTTLVARLTPGHTRGCTTWTTSVQEDGRERSVVIIGSMGSNPGFQFVNNKDNPGIAEEYKQGFKVLRSLKPDVPLASHPAMYDMVSKFARIGKGPNPFIDPVGYTTELDAVEGLFLRVLADQQKAAEGKGQAGAPTPVPTFTAAATTATSRPYGSNDAGVADLAAVGYTEEEYFISGTASGRPYTTRILVRRPVQPDRFSGIVIAESIRSTAIRSMWSLRDYFVRSGHAYVEIGSNHLAINKLVKPSDPARYGPLDLPAIEGGVFGHVMEVIAQGGMLLKTNPKGGPFAGFKVRRVILAGCSEQGVIIRQYMRDGHPVHRTAAGKSIYDGYFPACVADWPEQFILVNGKPLKNFTPGPIEVPVINLAGQQEVESWPEYGRRFRRPDADAPGDKYRVYEVAGMGHGTARSGSTCAPGQQRSRFAAHHVSANALDRLIKWVDNDSVPPREQPLATSSSSGPLLKDTHGNAVGGVRSVDVDVPVATFFTCVSLGTYEVPFPAEKMASLYPTPRDYLAKVSRTIDALVRGGWLLGSDADEARSQAAQTARDWTTR